MCGGCPSNVLRGGCGSNVRWVSKQCASNVLAGVQDVTSRVTPWTPCPARPTTTASKELCRPFPPQRHAGSTAGLGQPGWQHGKARTRSSPIRWSQTSRRLLPSIRCLRRQACRGLTTSTERDHHDRAPERTDPLSHPCGAHLPQRRVVPALGARPSRPHREGPARMRALPAEKSRQGCERREGSLSRQTHCLTHDNLFAQIRGNNHVEPFLALAAPPSRRRRKEPGRMPALSATKCRQEYRHPSRSQGITASATAPRTGREWGQGGGNSLFRHEPRRNGRS